MSSPHALAFALLGLGKILIVWLAPGCFHPGEDSSRIWLGFMGCLNLAIGTVYLANQAWLLGRRVLAWRPHPLGRLPQPAMQTVTRIVFPWHESLPRPDAARSSEAASGRPTIGLPETLTQAG